MKPTRLSLGLVIALVAVPLYAAPPTVSTSVTARVLHDTNLYLQDPAPLVAGQTLVAAQPREAATALDAALNLGLVWKNGTQSVIEAGYAPELFRYFNHSSENHTDHTLSAGLTENLGAWTAEAKAKYLLTDGSREAPTFNCVGGAPAIGGEPVRARREQTIARGSAKLTRRFEAGFARGVLALFDQDFRTNQRATTGYTNYTDRGEWSGGGDVGWSVLKKFALVAGARVGRQHQADILGVPLNYTNTFTRWLAGFEGTIAPAWKLSLLAGPDIRHYGQSVRAGFDHTQRTGYGESAVTWTPDAADSVALTAKRYLWLGSGGRGAYVDAIVDVSWKRKLSPEWSVSTGGNFHDGATGHYNLASPRHDKIYTGTLGLSRALGHTAKIDAEVMHDWSATSVPNTAARVYSRWTASLAYTRMW